ncbi:cytochrome P460 family protein [Caulobacter sp. Root1455]|uniref:cytochrome P460 family protein n=1 Tax=Caulobacter sp. Root1455 TaxID=1736465 RepID=UPI0009E668E8|nr:cytochrome P460 family protein [Caulobacter sp. Root1455]
MRTPSVRMGRLIIALAAFGLMGADAPAPIPDFPDGYRDWRHVSTGLIGPHAPAYAANGGFHHIYANPAALRGYKAGRFPDGAVLVYDLFEAVDRGGDVTAQGPRRHVDVMVKDSRRFARTGGWGYAEFAAGERAPRPGMAAACHACHERVQARDYVFSGLRD